MDLAPIYGIAGAALLVAGYLARTIWDQQMQKRAPAASEGDAPARRVDVAELKGLKEDVRAVRVVVEAMRDLLQAQVTKIAVLEYRMAQVEKRCDEGLPRS